MFNKDDPATFAKLMSVGTLVWFAGIVWILFCLYFVFKNKGKWRVFFTVVLLIMIVEMINLSFDLDGTRSADATDTDVWNLSLPTPTVPPLPRYTPMAGPTATPNAQNTPTPFALMLEYTPGAEDYIPTTPTPTPLVIYTAQATITSASISNHK